MWLQKFLSQKKQVMKRLLILLPLALTFSFAKAPGGDRYRIYVDDKMLVEEYVGGKQQETEHPLTLAKPAANGRLIVYYSHCGAVGQNRSIRLKDRSGNTLKEWKFADDQYFNMAIPLQELTQALGKATASLQYSAHQLDGARILASVHFE